MDFFICYSSKDAKEYALKVYDFLVGNGFTTFCDLIDDPKFQLKSKIYDEISRSKSLIFLNTSESSKCLNKRDSWIYKEIHHAQEAGLSIINIIFSRTFKKDESPNKKISQYSTIEFYGSSERLKLDQSNLLNILNLKHFDKTSWDKIFDIKVESNTFIEFVSKTSSLMGIKGFVGEQLIQKLNYPTLTIRKIAQCSISISCNDQYQLSKRVLLSLILINASRLKVPLDTKYVWALIIESISKGGKVNVPIRKSSQGFIVVPLFFRNNNGKIMEYLRLHIWSRNIQVKRNIEYKVHSHQSTTQSWVICGGIINVNYYSQKSELDNLSEFKINWSTNNSAEFSPCHQYSKITNLNQAVRINPIDKTLFKSCETYNIQAGNYHSTEVEKNMLTVTVFLFDSIQGWEENARIIGPKSRKNQTVNKEVNFKIDGILDEVSILLKAKLD